MTAESKQERDRRYAREYRARQRVVRAERARAASDGVLGPVRQSVDAAVEAMKWIAPSDGAAVAQARAVATIVDSAMEAGELSLAIRAHGLLSRLLDALGGTPRVRMQLELRSRRLAVAESDDAPARADNVVRFPRPPKRSSE
ncbi:terminase small subunit [Microbacterium lemovicicum]|uniref:terminase small subunit n=1 Tax=Microbacterium lemovicicum TaxID=1072463 RepID=UPI003B96FFA7